MILLTTTSDVIEIITGSSVSTICVQASYEDVDGAAVTPGRTNTLITTATTTTVVASPGASTFRALKNLSVTNTSASTCAVTVEHTDGTHVVSMFSYTMNAGEQFQWSQGAGWVAFDASGNMKVTTTGGGGGSGSGTVSSGTSTQVAIYGSSGTTVSGSSTIEVSGGVVTLPTGSLVIGVASTTGGSVLLEGSTSGSVTVTASGSAITTYTLTLPTSAGSANQFLKTDGSGNTSWASPSGSGTVNSGTSGQLAGYSSTGTAVSGNANLTFSSGTLTLGQADSIAGALVLNNTSNSDTVTISGSQTTTTYTFTLPANAGTSGYVLSTDGSGNTSWVSNSSGGSSAPTVNAQTATYETVAGDANNIVTMSNASANTCEINVGSGVGYAVGTQIFVIQIGAGQTQITASSGNILNAGSQGTSVYCRTQYSSVTLTKISTGTTGANWVATGDLM